MTERERVEQAAARIGADILRRIEASRGASFAQDLERDPLVVWARRGEAFLAQVFRFIDLYPVLESDAELLDYLTACIGDPHAVLLDPSTPEADVPAAVRSIIRDLASRFAAGETLADALRLGRRLHEQGYALTLDILGEAVTSEREADDHTRAYLDLIGTAAPEMADWPHRPQVDRSSDGPIPRLNVSLKPSSLYSRFDPIDRRGSFDGVAPRLRAIFRAAREHDASINVDLEQYVYKDLTFDLVKRLLMEDDFRDWPHASVTVQTYLADSRDDLAALAEWAAARGTPINVRLVKGAYWDHEVQQAAYHRWPTPVFTAKDQTDAAFEAGIDFLFDHHALLRPAIATHNVRSAAYAMAAAMARGLRINAVEHQTLLGLGDELKQVAVRTGHRMRVYTPCGGLAPGMAYLVRRLLEATARSAYLRQMAQTPLPASDLLKAPGNGEFGMRDSGGADSDSAFRTPHSAFSNEPVLDFSRAASRAAMERAIEQVRGQFGRAYPLWIDGKGVKGAEELVRVNPGAPDEVIGRVSAASRRQALAAVRAAQRAFPAWAAASAQERADLLLHAAAIMRRRRAELAAWEVFEEAKPWREADADVAEAIDYLDYYAREAVRLAAFQRRDVLGEDNAYFYEPRGVAAVIAPWNFPLAILTGMTSGAAAAGNTVIMKPAEQSSVVAAKLMEVFTEAGLPRGVIQYLPGRGEVVGERLVQHPDVALIAFTGSLAVGLRIHQLAARVARGQTIVKRVILEMGGKNAIIVDRDADLDQAVPGVIVSAFGYAGQKCSACSRVIVHQAVYARFLDRLVEAVRSLPIGPAWDPHTAVGPLIDDEAQRKVRQYADLGRHTARVVYDGNAPSSGFYAAPLVLADVDPASEIAQEEVFGPILCVIRAADFEQAVAIANGVRYGLTGGLFSRNPRRIDHARSALRVGNLYVNRPITGAMVDRQPFGGVKLSGIGSKAGGPDYLLQFLQPKAFTENTVRRGFTPPPASPAPRPRSRPAGQ
jgi:RHH-type proline utilization regulon transcriptional repressor/proline dehydrogenase/delta 1-pyrroline-5-carboxylate dehydrogenase